jgi:F-type H+-transporting ATPase subunit b
MRRIRILSLILLGAAWASAPLALRAEDPSPKPAHETQATPPQHGEAGPGEAGHGPAAGGEHAAAAGHGAGAHHGPEVKLFGTVLSPGAQYLIKLINFALFAGGLIWLTKGALSAAFKARAQEIEDRLNQAEKDRLEGEAQVRELEARMAGMQQELGGILAKADADAEAEKQRILAAARAEAEVILAQAQSEIDFQRRHAEQELRALVVELAVQGAAQRLQNRLQGAASEPVVERAIEQISLSAGGKP